MTSWDSPQWHVRKVGQGLMLLRVCPAARPECSRPRPSAARQIHVKVLGIGWENAGASL